VRRWQYPADAEERAPRFAQRNGQVTARFQAFQSMGCAIFDRPGELWKQSRSCPRGMASTVPPLKTQRLRHPLRTGFWHSERQKFDAEMPGATAAKLAEPAGNAAMPFSF